MAHWTSKSISSAYEAFRPTYPPQLYDAVLKALPQDRRLRLIDIGCGTGQVFKSLAPHFGSCLGIDPSASQVEAATKYSNAVYAVGGAESFILPKELASWEGSVDLVTVAQAMHWFDMPKFADRVDRVLAPGGVLAVWLYNSIRISHKACDEIWDNFDKMMLREKFWPDGRRHIDNEYVDLVPALAAKLQPLDRVVISQPNEITVERWINYMSTMSGVNGYIKATGHTAVLGDLTRQFTDALGAADPATATMNVKHDFILFTFQKRTADAQPKL